MMGLRNLYKVFRETRNAAREQATLAVVGDSPRASEVAALLGAQRNMRGAEIILSVSETGTTISGKAVEDPGEISLPSRVREGTARRVDGAYRAGDGRGLPGRAREGVSAVQAGRLRGDRTQQRPPERRDRGACPSPVPTCR